MSDTKMLEAARTFVAANRPEPAKCVNCGQAADPYVTMPSGMAIYCPKAPAGTQGHSYIFTVTDAIAAEESDAKRLAAFASEQVRERTQRLERRANAAEDDLLRISDALDQPGSHFVPIADRAIAEIKRLREFEAVRPERETQAYKRGKKCGDTGTNTET